MTDDFGANPDEEPVAARRNPIRTIRIELFIAMLALLASSVASIGTLLQTRTIGEQFSVSVWPYLITEHRVSHSGFELGYTNKGLGPAIVREFRVAVDGREQPGWYAAARRFDPMHQMRLETERDFGVGSVMQSGETYVILVTKLSAPARPADDLSNVRLSPTSQMMQVMTNRIELTTCYCSLLEKCWRLHSQESEPRPVPTCGESTPLLHALTDGARLTCVAPVLPPTTNHPLTRCRVRERELPV